ncbi:MAG: helix-turn-helix domain-containing protein [Neomegalonema sp.]|nr:helix-turn-helix domain-containing protein [Neomegalonema sp.]
MASENDALLGRRLRRRRWMLGLTQSQVAERVGIKFQQIQKYESGQNRISASRLWDLSVALDAPVSYFYEDIASNAEGGAGEGDPWTNDAHARESADLLRAYYGISEDARRRLFELIRTLGAQPTAPEADDKGAPSSHRVVGR